MWGKNYWKLDILSSRVIGVIIQELYKVSIYKLVDSGHSVSAKLTPDKEKFCVVHCPGQWWVSNIVQQNFGQLYVLCWPKYDLTRIWGWTNVLYKSLWLLSF